MSFSGILKCMRKILSFVFCFCKFVGLILKMKKQLLSLVLICVSFASKSQLFTQGSGVMDIDGNNYQSIIINGQEWMAENLKTSKYSNGDVIPNVIDNIVWSNLSIGAWAHYSNNNQYENPFGKLYNWYTVADQRNLCPTGWHVPSDAEYTLLTDYLGGGQFVGGKMKSIGTQYWQPPNTDATNESSFSGLPGAFRISNGYFTGIGNFGYWWCATEEDSIYSLGRSLTYSSGAVGLLTSIKKNGLSVRCLKNSTSSINEIKPIFKTLLRITDIMGRETIKKNNEVLFYLYSDGSVEKKMISE